MLRPPTPTHHPMHNVPQSGVRADVKQKLPKACSCFRCVGLFPIMRSLQSSFVADPPTMPMPSGTRRGNYNMSLAAIDPAGASRVERALHQAIMRAQDPNFWTTNTQHARSKSTFGTGARFVDASISSTGLLVPHASNVEKRLTGPRVRTAPSGLPVMPSSIAKPTRSTVVRTIAVTPNTWTSESLASLNQTIDRIEARTTSRHVPNASASMARTMGGSTMGGSGRRIITADALRRLAPPSTDVLASTTIRSANSSAPPAQPAAQEAAPTEGRVLGSHAADDDPRRRTPILKRPVSQAHAMAHAKALVGRPRKRVTFHIEPPLPPPEMATWPPPEPWPELTADADVPRAPTRAVEPSSEPHGWPTAVPPHAPPRVPPESHADCKAHDHPWPPREPPAAGLPSRRLRAARSPQKKRAAWRACGSAGGHAV